MKLKAKNIILCTIILTSISLAGCVPNTMNITDMERVAMTVLDEEELVSIKEIELDDSSKKGKSKKDLNITLNLSHSAKSVALDNALLKITRVISALEGAFEEKLNDYKFIINTTQYDVYGNEQKIKILEILIDNDEIEKIRFRNFDYKNLEQLSEIKTFNYLKEDSNIENEVELNAVKNDSE